MTTYTIIKCRKCGEPAIHAPKMATKCRSCSAQLDPKQSFTYYETQSAREASWTLRKLKERIARAQFGS
jgi:predicted RNA-binding Zn-ribbon protein involved in translation (DUF1610 family)